MSISSAALTSLKATYTDSEGEEVDDELHDDLNVQPDSNLQNLANSGQSQEESKQKSGESTTNSPVNILGKAESSDEEIEEQRDQKEPSQNGNQPKDEQQTSIEQRESVNVSNRLEQNDTTDGETNDCGVIIPADPPGQCPADLQEKIKNLYTKMKSGRLDMNTHIQNKKEFRNPSIYEKLIQFCSINELGTNYPPERFDPFKWNKDSFYDELAKAQKIEMEKLEKSRKEKSKIEIITGTAKRPNNSAPVNTEENANAKKRKSKWDQVSTNSVTAPTTNLNVNNCK